MRTMLTTTVLLGLLLAGGCPSGTGANPFLTFTETYGSQLITGGDDNNQGGGSGSAAAGEFRRTMTLTLANRTTAGDVNVAFAAWVNSSSIRNADQQDSLFRSGYIQLTREVQLGSVYTLPPGTFVYNGPGYGGATRVVLPSASSTDVASDDGSGDTTTQTIAPGERSFTLITPDVLLVFQAPPNSCESVAYTIEQNGDVIGATGLGEPGQFGGADRGSGFKTLSQVDVYQCEPLRPGLFLKLGGGVREPNEFLEGQSVRFDFDRFPDDNGHAAFVTISQ